VSRLEIAIWWVSVWAFVLITSNFIISEIDKFMYKKKASRIQPVIEVYGKNYKKQSTPGRVFNKKC